MAQQVFVVHGGETFNTYEEYVEHLQSTEVRLEDLNRKDWKSTLAEKLGETYQVLAPRMPCSQNARYAEWKIWFEKFIPFLTDGVIFVGHSLGGTFLAKYLSEETLPKRIQATFLVAARYSTSDKHMADFNLSSSLNRFAQQGGEIYLYHSRDDEVVPFSSLEEYAQQLPNAQPRIFADRQHFNQEDFSEIVEDIRTIARHIGGSPLAQRTRRTG